MSIGINCYSLCNYINECALQRMERASGGGGHIELFIEGRKCKYCELIDNCGVDI